jgi:hypothetical protein
MNTNSISSIPPILFQQPPILNPKKDESSPLASQLPSEMMSKIFFFSINSPQDAFKLMRVCKNWHRILVNDSSWEIWRKLYFNDFINKEYSLPIDKLKCTDFGALPSGINYYVLGKKNYELDKQCDFHEAAKSKAVWFLRASERSSVDKDQQDAFNVRVIEEENKMTEILEKTSSIINSCDENEKKLIVRPDCMNLELTSSKLVEFLERQIENDHYLMEIANKLIKNPNLKLADLKKQASVLQI